jgi:hypothetical protein
MFLQHRHQNPIGPKQALGQILLQVGVLTDDDPVELLEGLLAAKMHESRRLCGAGCLVGSALEAVVPAGWFVASAIPLRNRWLAPFRSGTGGWRHAAQLFLRRPLPAAQFSGGFFEEGYGLGVQRRFGIGGSLPFDAEVGFQTLPFNFA